MADLISQQGLYQDGNSIFENVHILGTLEVSGIVNTETTIKAKKFLGDGSELTGIDATTIKDSAGTTQIQGTTTGATHSGIAVFNELEVENRLYDGDGNFGTSGQVLSSDGTDTAWVNTGSLTAGAASEVGVTAVNTNSDHFITFVSSSSGNDNVNVDSNLKYNPSSNTIATIKINDLQLVGQLKDGDNSFGASGTVLTSDGTDTAWANVGTLAAGSAAKLSVTEDDTETDGRLLFSNAAGQTGGNEVKSDNDLSYNANTNTLTVANLSGTATQAANLNNHDTDDLSEGSSNQYFTTSRARGAISVGSEGTPSGNGSISYDSSTGELTFTPAAAAGTPTAITVADESNDTTCFPLFAVGATGNQSPKTGTNLTFNSSNGALTATAFSGDGGSLTNLNASSITDGTVSTSRLPNLYTKSNNSVTVQATGTGHDVKLDAARYIFFESGEEQSGGIYFRGNAGAGSYRFAKSGQEALEGLLSFENLSSSDKTYTFPNKSGTVAMTSDLFSGDYDDLTDKPTLNFVTDDASDTLTGGTYTFSSSTSQKIILRGATDPYIRFQEGTTNKGYLQWNSGGYMRLTNQETGEELRLGNGNNGLTFVVNSSSKTVWHSGNLTPFDGNYNSLSNKPSLFDGNYNSLSNKPTIPTQTSQLTNNSGFITGTDVRSMNEAASTGQSNTTSNSDVDKVTLSISTISNSRVLVLYGFEIKHSDTSNKSCVATVRGSNTSFVGGEIVETHKDTNFARFHGNVLDISSHTGTRTYRIQFRRSTSGGTASIRNAYLSVIEMSV